MSMRLLPALLALVLLVIGGAGIIMAVRLRPDDLDAAIALVAARHPQIARMTAAEVAGLPTDVTLVVDVRPEAEWLVSHLPGAFRANDADAVVAEARLRRVDRIIVYCSVGMRSSHLADRVQAMHPAYAISDLRGGIFAWAADDRPLVDGAGRPTRLVHPYDAAWGALLPADRRAPLP